VDSQQLRAAFDEQIRQRPDPHPSPGTHEYSDGLVRSTHSDEGWAGVLWSGLNSSNADDVIAAQVARFADLPCAWEWKHYSYDQPPDLRARLRAAGFLPEPAETLLVAEIAELGLAVVPPDGVELHSIVDQHGINALVSVHDEVFGGDHAAMGRQVFAGLPEQPASVLGVVAWAGETPISAGRVQFHAGTDFASLWGGGTLPAWRGRGVFRAMVAYRAAEAAARGFRYLQVDASPDSRPILQRLGFVELATTTPFTWNYTTASRDSSGGSGL
jgi:ribosomal protein S18 acetylase RimI-like enzyme